jgi:hypothetical protein
MNRIHRCHVAVRHFFRVIAACAITTVLPLLLVIKYAQVKRELATTGAPFTTVLLRSLERRLDDPSFWAIVACCVAAWFIIQAARQLSRSTPFGPIPLPSRPV